ncbi:hypothetical protein I553_7430 [Mycobacterium xenopi 4042]|uniref:DUF1707 domain-containing protein n=1 Tax=Mycobacterium xenopi 4042 TaxID=1299334 RepID=X8E788_MYCXE|nr:hypothetical protein I552_5030 [Mycobacterium xenopi 3993]EUA76459.1 hypothetical protein I553_7430 [Mycobacterium xenopi 4042]
MTRPDELADLRISDADRNGTLRRLHNAVALGLIDINEFEQRSSQVSYARTRGELDGLVGDLPGPARSSRRLLTVSSCAAGWDHSNATVNGSCRPGWRWCAAWARSNWTWSRPVSPDLWWSSSST